jgi:hypothetical protein
MTSLKKATGHALAIAFPIACFWLAVVNPQVRLMRGEELCRPAVEGSAEWVRHGCRGVGPTAPAKGPYLVADK